MSIYFIRFAVQYDLKIKGDLCLVFIQVPKCFVPVQIFWASPKIWLRLVPLQKLLCRHKNQFYWMQIIFLSGTKFLWLPQYVNEFLVWLKKFGPAQNILVPVKGQGIYFLKICSILVVSIDNLGKTYKKIKIHFWSVDILVWYGLRFRCAATNSNLELTLNLFCFKFTYHIYCIIHHSFIDI